MIAFARFASLAAAAMVACGVAPWSPPPSPDSMPEAAGGGDMSHCTRLLTEEAKASRASGSLVRNDRTFAKEFGRAFPPQLLLEKLTRRIDSDDFTDAYVRWQLSGFDVPEFAMTDRAFDRMLQTLPAFLPNPRADEDLIRSMNRAVQIGQLTAKQQEELNAALNDLAAKFSAATTLNLPALEFRSWLIGRCKDHPARAALLAIERAAALAGAGWPNDDARREVDALLERASRQREFTIEQRRQVILYAEKLITTGRMHIAAARVDNDALSVEYATTGIFDLNVRRWERMLRPES